MGASYINFLASRSKKFLLLFLNRQIEGRVVEISRLQEIFSEKVIQQVNLMVELARLFFCKTIGGFHKVPVQRTWWSVMQKNLIRI